MKTQWKFQSEDDTTISLHDCVIDRIEQAEDGLWLWFEDGFNVTKDNALNPTGRHRNTGPAAIHLAHARFCGGTFNRDVVQTWRAENGQIMEFKLPETPLTAEMFSHFSEIEILDFQWQRAQQLFSIDTGNWSSLDPDAPDIAFCSINLHCARVLFCWDDLPRDAWFQDWPRQTN